MTGGGGGAGRGSCSFVQDRDFISRFTTFFAISFYIPLIPLFVLTYNAIFIVVLSCLIPTSMRNLQPYEVRFKIQREL